MLCNAEQAPGKHRQNLANCPVRPYSAGTSYISSEGHCPGRLPFYSPPCYSFKKWDQETGKIVQALGQLPSRQPTPVQIICHHIQFPNSVKGHTWAQRQKYFLGTSRCHLNILKRRSAPGRVRQRPKVGYGPVSLSSPSNLTPFLFFSDLFLSGPCFSFYTPHGFCYLKARVGCWHEAS